MDPRQLSASINDVWSNSALPTLERYIRIPNQSPFFDPEWKRNGFMHQAVTLAREWVEQQGFQAEVHEIEGRTPLRRDGKLYGRGGADDGYAVFAAVSAVRSVQQQKTKHSRIVIIIECCE